MTTFQKPSPPAIPPVQRAYLLFVRDFIRDNRIAPSYGQIADAASVKRYAAIDAVKKLIAKKYLERIPGAKERNLRVTPAGLKVLRKG